MLFGVDTRPVKKFEESHSQCKDKSSDQNVEDTSHVTKRQFVLGVFLSTECKFQVLVSSVWRKEKKKRQAIIVCH